MTNNYRRWVYALVVLLTIIATLYLSGWVYGALQACGNILALYFSAWLLQFFFTPVVDFLTRHRLPRVMAVSYVYLVLALVVFITLAATLPTVYAQGQRLAGQLGNKQTYEVITNTTRGVERFLEQNFHVPHKDISEFTNKYSVNLRKGAFNTGTKLREIITSHLNLSNLSGSTNAFLTFLNIVNTTFLNFVIVLILAFYMTLDGHKLVRRALSYFPPTVGEMMENVHVIVNRKFGGYLRGQIILALSYGALTFLIALWFDLKFQIFIAVFAAVMMLIPFVGSFAAVVPPILAFILVHVGESSFPLGSFALLLVCLVLSQQVVINFLSPRVMGSAVGMHPLLVVLGLLLGAKIAGLWGAIFGVPVFGVMLDSADLIYRRIMDRRYGFHPPAAGDVDDAPQPPAPGRTANNALVTERPGDRGDRTVLPRAGASTSAPRRSRDSAT